MMPSKALDVVGVIHRASEGKLDNVQMTLIADASSREAAKDIVAGLAHYLDAMPLMDIDTVTGTKCYRIQNPEILVEIGWS